MRISFNGTEKIPKLFAIEIVGLMNMGWSRKKETNQQVKVAQIYKLVTI